MLKVLTFNKISTVEKGVNQTKSPKSASFYLMFSGIEPN